MKTKGYTAQFASPQGDKMLITNIQCTKADIYYENGMPYLNWYGEAKSTVSKEIAKVHIPKMSLDIHHLETQEEEVTGKYGVLISMLRRTFVASQQFSEDNRGDIIIEFVNGRKPMTQEQIEQELGYKIKILENVENSI